MPKMTFTPTLITMTLGPHAQGVKLFSTSPNRGTVGRPSTFELVCGDETKLQMFVRETIVSTLGVWGPN